MNNFKGIKLSIHPLFIIILFSSIFTGYFIELLFLFSFVIAHECGHFFMAKQFGWKINEIKLLPFGGVLVVDDAQATTAKEEVFVSLAGPLQNVFIICIIWLGSSMNMISNDWANYLIVANVWLIVFNLLPITPLDGGKIVQALLTLYTPYYIAIKAMVYFSLIGSISMIIFALCYPLYSNTTGPQLNILLIGIFLFFDNRSRLVHLPFTLYRFILQRARQYEHSLLNQKKDQVIPVFVHEQDSLFNLFKKMRRDSNHIFYCMNYRSNHLKMKAERDLIVKFAHSSHQNRALIEFFD